MEQAADNAFHNPRPLLNFAEILIQENRCNQAPQYLERAGLLTPNPYYVNAFWGRTLACLGHFDLAVQRFQTAARLQPTSQVYEWLGLAYGQMGLGMEAAVALQKAIEIDPHSETAHGSLALWYEKANDLQNAEREYRTARLLDSDDSWARDGWLRVRAERNE
jgi:Flp pilus assembly protein TadD